MKTAAAAEDIAYTINHALACTATDFIDPYFGNLTQTYLGTRFSVGCGHPHDSHTHAHDHHDHHHHSHLKQWWIGEVAGDFGAVPVTIFLQRAFPGAMKFLERGMESALGGFFRRGAQKSARAWAQKNQIEIGSDAFKTREEEIYRYEIEHLPQAITWTAASVTLNLATQRLLNNRAPLWQLAAGKAVGASISAALVVGARGLAPAAAHRWDKFTDTHIFTPATKAVGRIFGVEDKDVNALTEKEARVKDAVWATRVTEALPMEKTR